MEPINGITLEKYADLCALMANAPEEAQQNEIAAKEGISAEDWKAAKEGYTKRMSDPTDMGKTAMAFMPLYQEAQTKMRGGAEPCTLEVYAHVHANMAFRKDDSGNKIDYMIVLGENGFTHQQWIECESYWTPVVINDPTKPTLQVRYNAEKGATFARLIQEESDKINGIVR
jgi:hypothetical protein